jgi:phospholipase/carboxylesterase
MVWLHGARGRVRQWAPALRPLAETTGIIVIAPKSNESTWDRTAKKSFGKDTQAIESALTQVFTSYAVDPRRIAIGGFSDGATYALSLGLTNGALFSHILAFSPGGMRPGERHGRPAVFVTHGWFDQRLKIKKCSDRLVPRLRTEGYQVRYRKTLTGHFPAAHVAPQAIHWFLTSPAEGKQRERPSGAAPGSLR